MMFALNFVAVRFGLKFPLSNFFDPYKKPNGGNICRVNAPNNDFPYGKDRRGRGGRNQTFPEGNMSRFLACKASCRQDAASQSLLRRVSAVPSPGHKKS